MPDRDKPDRPPDGLAALRQAIGVGDDHDGGDQAFDELPAATHWPSIPATDAMAEWEALGEWVQGLQDRFAHLDHHVIPHCWWRHNEHVEALSALRDHERSSFSDTAPATAPLDWFRALRDIALLLRTWTKELACGATHQEPPSRLRPPANEEFRRWVQDDVRRRSAAEIEHPTT
jgi:hypothetical protein